MTHHAQDLAFSAALPQLVAWLLVACRLAGLFVVAPFFRDNSLSPRTKFGVIAALSICVLLSEPVRSAVGPQAYEVGLPLIASEFLVGGLLGWTVLLVLSAVRGACQIISQQIGLTTAVVVDPLGGGQDEVLCRFITALAIMVLLSAELHHALIRTVAASFLWVPPGTFDLASLPELLSGVALGTGPDLLVAAVSLALPCMVAMLLVSAAQGLLGRVLPEAELLVLGLPVRVIVGLGVLAMSLPPTTDMFRLLLANAVNDGRELVRLLSTGQ